MAIAPKLFPWFITPATPDLGCFVRNKHPFEFDWDFFLWNEFSPWEASSGEIIPHQVYFRVKCGKAAFHQQVRVWMTPANSDPPPLIGLPPDHVLGGAFAPMPSDWQKFAVRTSDTWYWFAGEHKPPQETAWRRDAAVGHSFDLYDNGTLSTVGWDDTGGDRDFNDYILEVAVVYRRNFFDDLQPIAFEAEEAERLQKDIVPKMRKARDKRAP
jgi:hypothetical protein